MLSRKRIRQWLSALRLARGANAPIPWLKMLRAILSPVPKAVWQTRIRTCFHCPLFDYDNLLCRSVHPQLLGVGCGCYIPFSALAPEPYDGGCYGRARFGGDFGWAAYRPPSLTDRLLAFPRLLLRK